MSVNVIRPASGSANLSADTPKPPSSAASNPACCVRRAARGPATTGTTTRSGPSRSVRRRSAAVIDGTLWSTPRRCQKGRVRVVARDFTIAVDIGGTFTDLIAFDPDTGRFLHAKSSSTPRDLVEGILACVDKSGGELDEASEVVHGSTVAINTVLEEEGAATALVVTAGTRDVYSIGRGNRPDAYNLFFRRPRPFVSRALTFEVPERMLASGEVLKPLDEDALSAVCDALRAADVDAVAVCFLHSYVNPDHERRAGEIIRAELPGKYVSLSHEILREYREYERTSTTVINSYVGPTVSRYI